MARTFYETLMVSPKADRELIGVVYRHLAKRFHPDLDPSPAAAARMAQLNEAYAVLSDPAKRARYDQSMGLASMGLASADTPSPLPGDGRATRSGGANMAAGAAADGHGEAGPPPANPPPSGRPLTFGRYRGWTLNQVGRYDHDYLEWLARTTMGRNFKRELDELLRRAP